MTHITRRTIEAASRLARPNLRQERRDLVVAFLKKKHPEATLQSAAQDLLDAVDEFDHMAWDEARRVVMLSTLEESPSAGHG